MVALAALAGFLGGVLVALALVAWAIHSRPKESRPSAPAPVLPQLPKGMKQRQDDGVVEVSRSIIPGDILMLAQAESEPWAREEAINQALDAYRIYKTAGHTDQEAWQAARLTFAEEGVDQ